MDSHSPVFSEYTDRWGTFRTVMLRKVSSRKHIYLACADIEISTINEKLISRTLISLCGGLFLLLISLPLLLVLRRIYRQRSDELKRMVEQKTNDLKMEMFRRNEVDEKVKYSEEKFARAFEKSPQMLFIVEYNSGNIVEANTRFIETVGLKRNEVTGSFILTVPFFVTATDYEYIKKIIDEKGFVRELEISFRNKNENGHGSLFAEIISIKNRKHLLFIVNDITKSKKLEEEVLKAKEKAEMSDRLKSAFLANMSHEIRTPMNSIIGFAGLLRNEELNADKRREFLEIIYSNGNSLLAIINDIIDFSKIEAGQLKINYNDVLLNQLMKNLHQVMLRERAERGRENIEIGLSMTLKDKDSYIRIDDIRLTQILTNLLTNAVKFTEEGRIDFGYELNGDYIRFFVKDSGIGIPKDKQTIIFERFQQLIESKTSKFGGTGLGLSISKALVELMGGRIWVESEVNAGSRFFFDIPFRKPKNILSENTSEEKGASLINVKGKSILVADDDKSSRTLLSHIITKLGATVYTAGTGNEVLKVYQEHPGIRLILLDINMPEKDGYQVMKEIRALQTGVKIVFQTALAMADERQKIQESGCDACIFKPISQQELQETLNLLLGE
jgi:PAS domain S-box-containing protein